MQDAHPLPSASTPEPVVTRRGPSPEIARWFGGLEPVFVAYVDLAHLVAKPLTGGLLANADKLADAATAKCVQTAAAAGQELVVMATQTGTLGALRFDPARFDPSTCFDGALHVVAPGVALFGAPALVSRTPSPMATLPDAIALDDDEYLRATFSEKDVSGRASLSMTDALLAFHADGVMPEASAKEAAMFFEQQRKANVAEPLARVLDQTTLRVDGHQVVFAMDLRESTLQQARDVGMLASLAAAGVRKYLLQSKEAEARATVPVIARAIAADWERETMPATPRAKKKLRSFPPIPQIVPRAAKYQSSEKEWATWSALKFEMDQPQYYQYEVRAAKDGESADVIARGDLNGDGKTSSFVITIHVKKDKTRALEISPIVETDPDE